MLAQLGAIALIVAPVFGLIGLGFIASVSGTCASAPPTACPSMCSGSPFRC